MVVSSRFLTIGLVLAVILLVMTILVPLGKGLGYLLTSVTLVGRRSRAITVSLAVVLLLVTAIGLVPVSAGAYASGVLEPVQRAALRAEEDGFLAAVQIGRAHV